MFTKLLAPLTLGLGLLSATATAAPTISGSGIISVVVGGTFDTANPSNSTVGCINAAGKVTQDDCATFTVDEYHISTAQGICSFHNASEPANTDSLYGAYVYAFTCWDHETVSTDVQFYTVVSSGGGGVPSPSPPLVRILGVDRPGTCRRSCSVPGEGDGGGMGKKLQRNF